MSLRPLTSLLDSLRRSGAGVLFPRCCCACGAAAPEEAADQPDHRPDGRPAEEFCPGCAAEIALIAGPGCGRCGAPNAQPRPDGRCVRCVGHTLRFDHAVAVGVYEGLWRRLVLATKQPTGEGVSAVLGRLAAQRLATLRPRGGAFAEPDVVTCVPMHWRRRFVRRHNSPEVIGEVMSRALGVPFEPRLIAWRRRVRKQSDLSLTDRRRNVRQALRLRRGFQIHGANIIVVDDVLTTGATCSEAARALKQGGAAAVVAVVAARSL